MSGTEELGAVGQIAKSFGELAKGRREYANLLRAGGKERDAAYVDLQANFDDFCQKSAWTVATEIIQTDMAPGL